MRYYPVYLDLRERECVVAGGGRVAERKALGLLEAGGQVTVISPALTTKLGELAASGKITVKKRTWEDRDLAGAYLVVAATGSEDVNSRIGKLCRKERVLVNVAAPPEESSFIVPSVVDRGDLLIAISTSGSSPALSKKIRRRLEEGFGPEYALFLERMAALRSRLIIEIGDESKRAGLFQALADSDVLDLLKQGRLHEADRRIAEITGLKMR